MRLPLQISTLVFCPFFATTYAQGILLYEVYVREADGHTTPLGTSQVSIADRDIHLVTHFSHAPHFIALSSLASGFQIHEHFHYEANNIILKGKLITDAGTEILGINNEASATFKATPISAPDNGALANPGYRIRFQTTTTHYTGPVRDLTQDFRAMRGFPFRTPHAHSWPVSEKIFTSMLILLYNDNLACTGSNTALFYDTVSIRRKYADGRVQLLDLNAFGKKYLVLAGPNQYWLTTWVIANAQYGVSEGTVTAFEYQKIGHPAIRHSLVLSVSDEDEARERDSHHNQLRNSGKVFKKAHRRINSNAPFQIDRIQRHHLRSHSHDFQITKYQQADSDYTASLTNLFYLRLNSKQAYLP